MKGGKVKVMDMFRKIAKGWKEGFQKGALPSPLPEEEPPLKDRERTGWISPVYTRSKRVLIDPSILIEHRCVGFFSVGKELEPYRVLRTQILQRTLNRGGNTLMITSPNPKEGKSLCAINLGFVFAKTFRQTVLLVDCDLRQQSIHKILGVPSEKGLVNYFLGDCSLEEIILWPGVEKMTFISGTTTHSKSSELLGSEKMKELVLEMKTRYPERYILFDTPPVLSMADAIAFAPFVDHILLVTQAGKTPLSDIQKALDVLPKEKIVGIVLNRYETRRSTYSASYPMSG